MRIENRTGRAVWVGLYDLNDQVYGRTTLPGMTREPLGSGTTGTFTPKPDKLQIVFWTHRKLGRQLTTPKEVLTTEAAIAEDTGAFYVYNHLGAPTPADRNAAAGPPTPAATPAPAPAPAIPGTISLGHVSPNAPVAVRGAKDSIFNSRSFNAEVMNFEFWLRERAGLTDKDDIRAAVFAGLLAVAKAPTPKDRVLLEWLALQVRQTRIEAARLALAEYDQWNRDPWSYKPPPGYDFPAYHIPPKNSLTWLSTTPNPPVLANTSWQSVLADILSGGGWSALNNPMLKEWQRKPTLEGVIGFPVFGVVRAYQNLYDTDEGLRSLVNTAKKLNTKSYNISSRVAPIGIAGAALIQDLKNLYLKEIAPFSQKKLEYFETELTKLNKVPKVPSPASGIGPELSGELAAETSVQIQNVRAAIRSIMSASVLDSYVCAFMLTVALQALLAELMSLDTKIKLRKKLAEALEEQQRAPLPDLRNLLYHDIRGEIVMYAPDYQPTDPVELERLMGGQEVYRAFLLATIA